MSIDSGGTAIGERKAADRRAGAGLRGWRQRLRSLTWHLTGDVRRPARSMGALEQRCRALLERRGEASSLALSTQIVAELRALERSEAVGFLEMLATAFDPRADRIERAIAVWSQAREPRALIELAAAIEPPRQELFRRLNMDANGTRALVDLRAILLESLPARPYLAAVEADLKHLFSSWFNRGFLVLERIDWTTPADVLERLIRYEAVHHIRGFEDLRVRLAPDRRCFAFFHPALPRDPLIFVEVALTRGIPREIASLIDPDRDVADSGSADTAVFYSISNCQRGLQGISLGSFLIKQVMAELAREHPAVRTFVTLSPIPELARALAGGAAIAAARPRLERALRPFAAEIRRISGSDDPVTGLGSILERGERGPAVERAATRAVLAYLLNVRSGARVRDPVAHFHLSNGARVERVNVAGDVSPNGRASLGVMVNYLYDPDLLEANHERYASFGNVALSPALGREARDLQPGAGAPLFEPSRRQQRRSAAPNGIRPGDPP